MPDLDLFNKKRKKNGDETQTTEDNAVEITTAQEENVPVDPENVSISDFSGHVALSGIKRGSCESLLGRVTIVAFLVNEFNSGWTDQAVEAVKRVLIRACETLERESGLSKNELSVSYAYDVVPVQLKYIRGESYDIFKEVLAQYGDYHNVASYQWHYEDKFRKDVAPIVFMFNRDFRSYAHNDNSEEQNKQNAEFSFVSYHGDETDCLRVLLHELMHQFGAIDYYYPESIKSVANRIFPDSIMGSGTKFDDLTKYVIGWNTEPTEKMLEFLNETKNVTEADIIKAMRAQAKFDW